MPIRTLLLTLLCALAATPALAAEQKLVYDLFMGERSVGTREVTTTVVPAEPGVSPETRLMTVVTQLDARVAGVELSMLSRADARVTDRKISFVASTRTNGETVEIQGRTDRTGGWLVTAVTPGKVQELTYRATEVDLTNLDLLDPKRRTLLDPLQPRAEVLLAETGTVVEGAVRDLGDGTLTVGGDRVSVERIEWSTPTGPVTLAWTADGTLASFQLQVVGAQITGRLRALPPPPSWEAEAVSTDFLQPGTSIHEQEL